MTSCKLSRILLGLFAGIWSYPGFLSNTLYMFLCSSPESCSGKTKGPCIFLDQSMCKFASTILMLAKTDLRFEMPVFQPSHVAAISCQLQHVSMHSVCVAVIVYLLCLQKAWLRAQAQGTNLCLSLRIRPRPRQALAIWVLIPVPVTLILTRLDSLGTVGGTKSCTT